MSRTFILDEEGKGGGEKDKSAFIDHRLSPMVKSWSQTSLSAVCCGQ